MTFTDLLSFEYRWPKKGDRLLRSSADWDRGVEFSNNEITRHVLIWDGYMRAGAASIEASLEDRRDRQFLIYPILFNYRHAIELAMKWIVARYGRYAGVPTGGTEHHDLWQFWKLCRRIILDVGGPDDGAIDIVEQVIKNFHDLDKTALAFRYATDKSGALLSLPNGVINLENIGDVMEAVNGFFGGCDGLLDANVSAAPW